jgi:hypothetical protein
LERESGRETERESESDRKMEQKREGERDGGTEEERGRVNADLTSFGTMKTHRS